MPMVMHLTILLDYSRNSTRSRPLAVLLWCSLVSSLKLSQIGSGRRFHLAGPHASIHAISIHQLLMPARLHNSPMLPRAALAQIVMHMQQAAKDRYIGT